MHDPAAHVHTCRLATARQAWLGIEPRITTEQLLLFKKMKWIFHMALASILYRRMLLYMILLGWRLDPVGSALSTVISISTVNHGPRVQSATKGMQYSRAGQTTRLSRRNGSRQVAVFSATDTLFRRRCPTRRVLVLFQKSYSISHNFRIRGSLVRVCS